ncbi:hypothetical protein J437_LFUL000097 [Ladona fulva]|uniref:Transmembrane protein 164 n=1 Tax=Ladona fulva TaxID=123851 RepID=A0A8K0NXH6_LADFU|nr:hypothetical protein J437_LFUL000097 [Ladona fulva]
MFDWAIAGVNISLPSEGGPKCAAYLPLSKRLYETIVILGIAVCVFFWARSHPVLSRIFLCRRSECKIYREQHSQGIPSSSREWNNRNVENDNEENENLLRDNRNLCPVNYCSENKLIRESLQDRNRKNWLLILLCLIWGAEIGFKLATRTVIYLFNPCHVVTAVQIYLLAAQPSSQLTAIFRMHLYFLNGAILAFLFPNTEARMQENQGKFIVGAT